MRLLKTACLLVALAFASNARASDGPGTHENIRIPALDSTGAAFTSKALSTDPTTAVLDVRGLRFAEFLVSFTYAAATRLEVVCYTGVSSSDVAYQVQSRAVSSGVATYSDYEIRKTVSASKKFKFRIDLHADNYLKCVFTATDETSDSITLTAITGGVD